ncbi:radical SAM protein [Patescibacteria group bacterium]|nr:radical SAM protein [Patescibacteria group bacterium]
MRIFLANPPCRIKIDSKKERFFVRAGSRWPFSTVKKPENLPEYIPFPFYLAYTAALLEKEGYEVIVDDGVATNQTEKEFLDNVLKTSPQVILFETSTPTINYDLKLVKRIKKLLPDIVVCLAGTHATTFFKEILKESKEVDFVFLGEYEINFTKFAVALKKDKDFEINDGIAFKKDGKIFFSEPKLIDPLDRLPFPARHLFPNNQNPNPAVYWDGFCQNKPSIQMHASRGCPFRCNFCLWNQVMYRNGKYRYFLAKRVVDEMEEVVKKYRAKEIYFDDDTFTANKKQVLDICREIKQRGLKISWSVMGDAMVTDKEMVEAMADAGCIGMKFGVESGNQKILKHIEKPVNFEKLLEFTDWCAKRRIKTHATFTFGLSGETKETVKETMDLAKKLDVDSVQFSITTPFPGTRYYEEVKRKKGLQAKKWADFDGSSTSIVRFEKLPTKEVVIFYKNASRRWLLHKLTQPFWVKRQISNLNRLRKGQGIKIIFKKTLRVFELLK